MELQQAVSHLKLEHNKQYFTLYQVLFVIPEKITGYYFVRKFLSFNILRINWHFTFSYEIRFTSFMPFSSSNVGPDFAIGEKKVTVIKILEYQKNVWGITQLSDASLQIMLKRISLPLQSQYFTSYLNLWRVSKIKIWK